MKNTSRFSVVLVLKSVVLLTLAFPTFANCDITGTPYRYLAAIEQQDMTTMAQLLSAEAHYLDPTMTQFNGQPVDLLGKDAIIKFWRDSFEVSGSGKLDYGIDECFTAGDTTVMTLNLEIEVAGAFWGVNKDKIDLNARHIMILRIVGKQIIDHTDYVDYASMLDQVEKLKLRYGRSPS